MGRSQSSDHLAHAFLILDKNWRRVTGAETHKARLLSPSAIYVAVDAYAQATLAEISHSKLRPKAKHSAAVFTHTHVQKMTCTCTVHSRTQILYAVA